MPRTYERVPAAVRFWRHVKKSDGCWLWTASKTALGYGQLGAPERSSNYLAHRLSYEINVGPIPDRMCVLHRCDTPACVNPAHLFLGTKRDNSRDMEAKGRTGGAAARSAARRVEGRRVNARQAALPGDLS